MHELRRPASGFQQWTLTGEESQPYFRQAVELGITFWVTANVYSYGGSEEIVDRAIERFVRPVGTDGDSCGISNPGHGPSRRRLDG